MQVIAQASDGQEAVLLYEMHRPGIALVISEGTVKTYALSIFEKLGVADRTDAVVTAQKRGILRG